MPVEMCRHVGSPRRQQHVRGDAGVGKQKHTGLINPEHQGGIDYGRGRQGFRTQYPGGGGFVMWQAALTV